jgi:holo-[acyl-carrier protein] synthase
MSGGSGGVRLAHGVDVVDVGRFRVLVVRYGERVLGRIFSDGEREYCDGYRDSVVHYAVRFAAKEAVLKALGTGLVEGMRWRDVEVVRGVGGCPGVRLWGRVWEVFMVRGFQEAVVSLSHAGGVAVASAILVGGVGD